MLAQARHALQVRVVERVPVVQVVEDEQPFEPAAERDRHRQHRLRHRQRAEAALRLAVHLRPHDVHALLHALGAHGRSGG